MIDLRDLAEREGLLCVETSSESKGYPRNIKDALVGFDTFEQAEALAKEHGLDIMFLHKKDGWQFWHRQCHTHEPMSITSADYGDDYSDLQCMSEEDFYAEEVAPMLDAFSTLTELKAFIESKEEIWDEMSTMGEGEIMILHDGKYYEKIEKDPMSWSFDTRNYEIGLVMLRKEVEASARTYPTNVDIFVEGMSFSIDIDFQDSEFFESHGEARDWAEERVDEIEDQVGKIDNYDDIVDALVSAVDRYTK